MTRDVRAPQEYWARQVPNMADFLSANMERFDERPVEWWKSPTTLAISALDTIVVAWKWFSSTYSAGAPAAELRANFDTVLSVSERCQALGSEHMAPALLAAREKGPGGLSNYAHRLWLTSLAVALEVDDATFARVVEVVRPSLGDRVLDRLVASRMHEHPIGDSLIRPKAVKDLDRVWGADDKAAAMQRYLDGWYLSWKGLQGWGGHEQQQGMHYFGYWAFETVGVVKVLEIDDASFRDQEYYPGDLLR